MKKVLALMALAATLFISCNKNNDPDDPNNNGEKEYVAPIKIDGTFDDWAKLDASKVQVLKCADPTTKTDLKLAKVYADKYYVFIYVEFDYSAYGGEVSDSHFDIIIDGDADTSTGGYKGPFDQGETPCIDLLIQGDVIAGGEVQSAYDPFVGTYSGAVNDGGAWAWTEVEGLTGFVEGKGDKKTWEFQITRELYPAGKLAKEFNMGIFASVNGWNATGALPNAKVDDVNLSGEAPLLKVNYNK
ncbi:MAG: hypothetical protein IKX67_05265 [Bacteroidales bacterium]|nr:hypothetical protein [Bacteroidales bacterium]